LTGAKHSAFSTNQLAEWLALTKLNLTEQVEQQKQNIDDNTKTYTYMYENY